MASSLVQVWLCWTLAGWRIAVDHCWLAVHFQHHHRHHCFHQSFINPRPIYYWCDHLSLLWSILHFRSLGTFLVFTKRSKVAVNCGSYLEICSLASFANIYLLSLKIYLSSFWRSYKMVVINGLQCSIFDATGKKVNLKNVFREI